MAVGPFRFCQDSALIFLTFRLFGSGFGDKRRKAGQI